MVPTRDELATTEPGGTATADQDTLVPRRDSRPVVLPEPGYDLGDVIGRGGMGEVVSAHDRRIDRDVAIKRMRDRAPSDASVTRFLREARIQGRLDHPAIVPVHELGVDAEGRPYFTMKRLAGVTLAQRMTEQVPLARLLRAFVEVCLAIEFAHARQIVHRDLKPSNIMLGDYGEVYVLDWGIARVLDGSQPSVGDAGALDTLGEGTQTGELLGTPGYMAPEQVKGQPAESPADVYALGAILFELLAGEPLHPRGSAALAMTLSEPQQAPGRRAPDREIAPELDAACVAALAEDPAARPTARVLGERVQRYLEGDRDHEHRRALAVEQLALARTAYDSGDPEQRATAMRSAGRALALDPESADAARLVTRLIVEPPRTPPAELAAKIADDDLAARQARLRAAIVSLACIPALGVLLPWLRVRSWALMGLFVAVVLGAMGYIAWAARTRRPNTIGTMLATLVLSIAFTRIIGSFILTPIVVAAALLSITAIPRVRAQPILMWAWLAAALGLPYLFEATGVFSHTIALVDRAICALSPMFAGQGVADAIALGLTNTVFLAAIALFGLRINAQVMDARHELNTQAWHLEQLLPARRVGVR